MLRRDISSLLNLRARNKTMCKTDAEKRTLEAIRNSRAKYRIIWIELTEI
jgi:hypothetical protein